MNEGSSVWRIDEFVRSSAGWPPLSAGMGMGVKRVRGETSQSSGMTDGPRRIESNRIASPDWQLEISPESILPICADRRPRNRASDRAI